MDTFYLRDRQTERQRWGERGGGTVLSVYVSVCTHMLLCVTVDTHITECLQNSEDNLQCWPLLSTRVLLFIDMYARLADSETSRDSTVSSSHLVMGALRLQTCNTNPQLYLGSGNSNPDPHAMFPAPYPLSDLPNHASGHLNVLEQLKYLCKG